MLMIRIRRITHLRKDSSFNEMKDSLLLVCRNGFQRLDKIKDSTRQSKQLEELTDKMRECKRYDLHLCPQASILL